MKEKPRAIIYGGGTISHVRPHLALAAPAYGKTAGDLSALFQLKGQYEPVLRLSRMASSSLGVFETTEDLAKDLAQAIEDPKTKIIVMSAAVCDFDVQYVTDSETGMPGPVGKGHPRLSSKKTYQLNLTPAAKVISEVRRNRKDIFLVGFKTTAGASVDEQYEAGMNLLKSSSCNLVLANDIHTRMNMVLTPEMASYGVTEDRSRALDGLVTMIHARAGLTFTRTEQVFDQQLLLPWQGAPASLKTVVDWLVENGAYPAFNDVTVGHFGFMREPEVLYSSMRKHNFNRVEDRSLVRVRFCGGKVKAFGPKPSAGARSQKLVLEKFGPDHCIVHFHCPERTDTDSEVPRRSQWQFECGSKECGLNTLGGMKEVERGIHAVMLRKHGPNIVFHKDIEPQRVIDFIQRTFDLTKRAGYPGTR